MFSPEAIDALVKWDGQVGEILVTRGLSPAQVKQLDKLLRAWGADPSAKNRDAILEAFPTPGDVDELADL